MTINMNSLNGIKNESLNDNKHKLAFLQLEQGNEKTFFYSHTYSSKSYHPIMQVLAILCQTNYAMAAKQKESMASKPYALQNISW